MKNKLEKLRNSQALTYDDLRGNGILQADPERDFAAGWDACQAMLLPFLLNFAESLSIDVKEGFAHPEDVQMLKDFKAFIGDES